MKNLCPTIIFCGIFFPVLLSAQAFMPSYSPSIGYKKGMVITMKGDTIHGTFQKIMQTENITSLTIKDEKDQNQKFSGEDIKYVLIKLSEADKLSIFNEGSSSMKKMGQTDYSQIKQAEYFIWERTVTPEKGKIKILQLVNPGFDSKIKVYRDPSAQETGGLSVGDFQITGGIEKSYYFVPNGEQVAVEVKKSSFDKQFDILFKASCTAITTISKNKKPDWDDLPAYVYANDQLCP